MNSCLVKTDIHFVLGKYSNINICAYKTINAHIPFRTILLVNHQKPAHFMFPKFEINHNAHNFSQIDNSIFDKLYEYLDLSYENKNNDREKKYEDFSYKGYYEYEGELYVFIEIRNNNKVIISNEGDNIITSYALVSEITNGKHLYGIPINQKLVDFILNNISLFTLYNSHGIPYEYPIVGYISKKREMLHYTCAFGISASSFGSIFGCYYYFTNYNNVKDAECIFRFAICLGNTLMKENFPNDDNIDSQMKTHRLSICKNNSEKMKLRISDYYGDWTSNYDSVILPFVELDDGTYIEEAPIICVKTPEQFKCLGCIKREIKINILENI